MDERPLKAPRFCQAAAKVSPCGATTQFEPDRSTRSGLINEKSQSLRTTMGRCGRPVGRTERLLNFFSGRFGAGILDCDGGSRSRNTIETLKLGKANDAVNGGVGRNLVNELPARSDELPRVCVSRSASPCSTR